MADDPIPVLMIGDEKKDANMFDPLFAFPFGDEIKTFLVEFVMPFITIGIAGWAIVGLMYIVGFRP